MSTIPPIAFQGKIFCHGGELQLTCENKTIRAHLIEPSGRVKSVKVEGFPEFLSNSENIQAFLNQSYVKLSDSKNGEMTARLYTKGLGGGKVEQLKAELDKKGKDKKAVFISYQWDHKDLAQAVEAALIAEEIIVLRDERAFQQSGENLDAFMQLINHPNLDGVIAIVSDKYLRSPNCMEEVTAIMKRFEWQKSLISIVVDGQLYQRGSEITYIKHWENNRNNWQAKRDKDLATLAMIQLESFLESIRFTIQADVKSLQQTGFQEIITRITGVQRTLQQSERISSPLIPKKNSLSPTDLKPVYPSPSKPITAPYTSNNTPSDKPLAASTTNTQPLHVSSSHNTISSSEISSQRNNPDPSALSRVQTLQTPPAVASSIERPPQFGKAHWELFFNSVSTEPLIKDVNNSLLTYPIHILIPKMIYGKPYTLNNLLEISENLPLLKGKISINPLVQEQFGNESFRNSYWIEASPTLIKGSRGSSKNIYSAINSHPSYYMPTVLEAVSVILTTRILIPSRGYKPFNNEHSFTTLCQEWVNTGAKHGTLAWLVGKLLLSDPVSVSYNSKEGSIYIGYVENGDYDRSVGTIACRNIKK